MERQPIHALSTASTTNNKNVRVCHHRAFEISSLLQQLDTSALRQACVQNGLDRNGTNVERAERLHDNAHDYVLSVLNDNKPDSELDRFVPMGDTDIATCDRAMLRVHHSKLTVHTARRDYGAMKRELKEMNKRMELYLRDIIQDSDGLQDLVDNEMEQQELLDQSRCDLRRAIDLVMYYGTYVYPVGIHMTREDGSIVYLALDTFTHVSNAICSLRDAAGKRMEICIGDSVTADHESIINDHYNCRSNAHVLLKFSTRLFCVLCFETALLFERVATYPHWEQLCPKSSILHSVQFDEMFQRHGVAALFAANVERCFLALEDVLIGDAGLDKITALADEGASVDITSYVLPQESRHAEHIWTRKEKRRESSHSARRARLTRLLFDALGSASRQMVLEELQSIAPREKLTSCFSTIVLRWQAKKGLGLALQENSDDYNTMC